MYNKDHERKVLILLVFVFENIAKTVSAAAVD